jgi:hypothetical protein
VMIGRKGNRIRADDRLQLFTNCHVLHCQATIPSPVFPPIRDGGPRGARFWLRR